MAKKTNLGIFNAAQTKWDKARRPDQSKPDFVRRYEESRLEWIKLKYKDFEVTEAVRSDLRPFLRSKAAGSVSSFLLSSTSPDILLYITKVTGEFKFECNGKTTVRTLPIVPVSIDSDFLLDPYNQPDDTYPIYLEQNDGVGAYLKVLSSNTPANLNVFYIKAPEKYDLQNNPDGFTEEEEMQQNEIIDLAVQKYLTSIGDFNTMQAQEAEIQTRGI